MTTKKFYQAHKEQAAAYSKEYKKTHKEQLRVARNKYFAAHKEQVNATRRKYYAAHKEEDSKRRKERYAAQDATHKERRNAYSRKYYRDHPENREKYNARSRQRTIRVRLEVLAHYGGKCVVCGNGNPNHLTIDHINDDGAEHRKRPGGAGLIYKWLKKNNYPDGFQILCWNHNEEKQHYRIMTPAFGEQVIDL
jgi:hypothetical protein